MKKIPGYVKGLMFCAVAFIALIAAGTAGISAALDSKPEDESTSEVMSDGMDVKEHHLKLSDGRTVLCIETARIGSWSCDWEGAK